MEKVFLIFDLQINFFFGLLKHIKFKVSFKEFLTAYALTNPGNLEKKIDINNIESAIEAKRSEMAEKRSEDLVDSYLKAKKMRVISTK